MRNKFLRDAMVALLMVILMIGVSCSINKQPVKADTVSDKTANEKINEVLTIEYYQKQVKKVCPDRSFGICNVCAINNLLNRRLALDLYEEDSYSNSKRFNFEYTLRSVGMNGGNGASYVLSQDYRYEVTGGSEDKVYTSIPTGNYSDGDIFSIDVNGTIKNYQLVSAELPPYNTANDNGAAKYFEKLLAEHPEGIFVRYRYPNTDGGHCIVMTSCETTTNGYEVKVIDTGGYYEIDQSLELSNSGKYFNDGKGLYQYDFTAYNPDGTVKIDVNDYDRDGDRTDPLVVQKYEFVKYLKEVKTQSELVMNIDIKNPEDTNNSEDTNNAEDINIVLTAAPKTINVKSSFNLKGSITSTSYITDIIAYVVNSDTGTEQQKRSATVYTNYVDIRTSCINSIKFGALVPGNYVLYIKAINEYDETAVYTIVFTVESSNLSVNLPSSLTVIKGWGANLTGTIESDYTITQATVTIANYNITEDLSSKNSKSIDIKYTNLNYKLPFGALPKGTYTLKVTATDSSGTTKYDTMTVTVQ